MYRLIIFFVLISVGCTVDDYPSTPIRTYEYQAFSISKDSLSGKPTVTLISKDLGIAVSYYSKLDSVDYDFKVSDDGYPIIMTDQKNNKWDVFGYALSGPQKGKRLRPTIFSKGFWFCWSSVYPQIHYKGEKGSGKTEVSDDELWLVSEKYVNRGAVKNGIKAIDFPTYSYVSNRDNINSEVLRDADEVVVVSINGVQKIFPIKILNYHEIVNDTIGGVPVSVVHSPYSYTTSVWKNRVNVFDLMFSVSGLVYNNNILMYDRLTDSKWSQLLGKAVNGPLITSEPTQFSFVQTTWGKWKELQEYHLIMDKPHGTKLDYETYPLGNYKLDNEYLPFPISNTDPRLMPKKIVFAIADGNEAKVFD